MVKAIIFDLWGTLVENGVQPSPSKQVKYFLRVQEQFPEFITTFEESFMTKDYESLKAAFEQVVFDFNIRIPDFVYEKLVGMWNKNAILSKMYEEVEETLKELKKKKIKLFLVTNLDKFSFEQVDQKYNLSKLFTKMYPSYQTGFLKSNKKGYEAVLKENKLKPADVLVVGDCLNSDISAAENAGLKAVLVDRRDNREYETKISTLKGLLDLV